MLQLLEFLLIQELVTESKGTPTIATSQLSTSLNSGNLAKVDGPAYLGTFVPLTGWIGFLFLSFNF